MAPGAGHGEPDSAGTAALALRIDRLERSISTLVGAADAVPAFVATATDVADDALREAADRDVILDERLRAAAHLAERLTDPGVLEGLQKLLDFVEAGDATLAMVGDVVDDTSRRLDLPARVGAGARLAEEATRPESLARLHALWTTLFDASDGMLSPSAVDTVGVAARALVDTRSEAPEGLSLSQALRATRDPDVRRLLGFGIAFAKHFSRGLDRAANP